MFKLTRKLLRVSAALLLAVLPFAPVSAQLLDIFSDDDLLNTVGSGVGCDFSARLKADMVINPLYAIDGIQCVSRRPADSGSFFADDQCTVPLAYRKTSQQQFCADALDKENLGQGGAADIETWTLSPGTSYDVGAASLEGLQQPYRTSVRYRSVTTARGQCQLEMRIYKNDLRAGQSKKMPLIALHGGSWSSRGFGSFGIEASVARYTEQGFIVFAPFYRLLGDREGSSACNVATLPQIVDDAAASLEWVETNAGLYGASGKPVVFGQSAGAHLALSLAVNFPTRVAGAVLLYPPTDFENFLMLVQDGRYTNSEGLGILKKVLGDEAASYDVSRSPVPENTFPALVAPAPGQYPPMFIVHGFADELVPASQSIRLCNGLAGRSLDQEFDTGDALQRQLDCGGNRELHLFAEGNHALDICIDFGGLLSSTCLSGGSQSRALVADQMDRAAKWASSVGQPINNSGGGGLFSLFSIIFLTMAALARRHRRCSAD